MNISLHLLFLLLLSVTFASATNVSHDGRAITIDGERRILISGSIHYPRSQPEMWTDLIKKAKAGGLDAIETYIFWNAHESVRRQYDFSGNLDFIRFLKTIQDEGLYAVLRIGPYVCAEWNFGGFPGWLKNIPGIEFRTNNQPFMDEMANFTSLIVDMVKKESLLASQGGPIILIQIENEYGNVIGSFGDAGKTYINWAANFAESLDVAVPWIMCQEGDAPQPMINTCNGFYCDSFTPNKETSPKMWTENWTGWFKNWGGKEPYRTAEDTAFAVARFFQFSGTFQNYYMYHGGTNFGRTAGGPGITTSYDYDAPLNEYGGLNQPKYGHLKELHDVLHSLEKVLTHGNVTFTDLGNSASHSVYTMDDGTSSCFFGNANDSSDATITYGGVNYNVPAWSVSIAPDCKTVVYNTAKVNTQTSVMSKVPNAAEDEPASLKWSWRPEVADKYVVQGKGQITAGQLLDQKVMNDVSDYLWYMTRVNLDQNDPIWSNSVNMTLKVNGSGHVMHAFVNGVFVGSQWPPHGFSPYVFEQTVKLNPGQNQISILSSTIGLSNYGAHFENVPTGLPGPIQIVSKISSDETVIKDLSLHKWSYQVGIEGVDNQLWNSSSKLGSTAQWHTRDLPVNRMFTWYKTTFKAPIGDDPVVLDTQGLGKGYAWINGHNIGRYWPVTYADDSCSIDACDYRGAYNENKCAKNCGNPTQRWYHVPREFMKDDDNELVLFEEIGGSPSLVNFQTVRVGTACGSAYESKTMNLSCEGRPISAIKFASFGDVSGACGNFQKGSCESAEALSTIQKACVGQNSCSVEASESVLGATQCGAGIQKRLLVEAVC